MKRIRPTQLSMVGSILLLSTVLLLNSIRINSFPAIGEFFHPHTGFWNNAEGKIASETKLRITGLDSEVIVKFDQNKIPHIFAATEHDLYFTQGYITAQDRLWQMDLQVRRASGTLSEVLGIKALESDRYQRKIGMTLGAENKYALMIKDPVTKLIMNAYTAGINYYIHHLKYSDYPLEFKILGYAPQDWKPINSVYILMLMTQTLAGGSDQFQMSEILKKFGSEAVDTLFSDHSSYDVPIIPKETKWDFKKDAIPIKPKEHTQNRNQYANTRSNIPGLGSNNWVLAGSKTQNGYPLLANDPHLSLTYPSIWYQIQMQSRSVNVYGVSIPGVPCVMIGFNERISWGVTNTGADVLDWYQIRLRDSTKKEYTVNNTWRPVLVRKEKLKIKGGQEIQDSILITTYGPLVYFEDSAVKDSHEFIGYAMSWIGYAESNELKSFYLLNRAKNYQEYKNALKEYVCPAQNFVFASSENDISVDCIGKLPLKFKDQGKFILDGTDSNNKWHSWIPFGENPSAKNPSQGYLASANQSLTDSTYPYYINWNFGSYERGKRINDRLATMNGATIDSMRILQNDSYSVFAGSILPLMTSLVETRAIKNDAREVLDSVKVWNLKYSKNSLGATIFDKWWDIIYHLTWGEKFITNGTILNFPTQEKTAWLLRNDGFSKWFNLLSTDKNESGRDIVQLAFDSTIRVLVQRLGPISKKWQWGFYKKTYIDHILNIPGLGAGNFVADGNINSINALKDSHGPSWKMIVQLGPNLKAYGVFPGGESGNPGSFYYDNMFHTWLDGNLNELIFLKSDSDNLNFLLSKFEFTPSENETLE